MYFRKSLTLWVSLSTLAAAAPSRDHSSSINGSSCLGASSAAQGRETPHLYVRDNKASAALESVKNPSPNSEFPFSSNPLPSSDDVPPQPANLLSPHSEPWSSTGYPNPRPADFPSPPAASLPLAAFPPANVVRSESLLKGVSMPKKGDDGGPAGVGHDPTGPVKVPRQIQVTNRPHLIPRGHAASKLKKVFKPEYQTTASLPIITCEGDKKKYCEAYCWCTNKNEMRCGKNAHLNLGMAYRTTKSLPAEGLLKPRRRECKGLCSCHPGGYSDAEQPRPTEPVNPVLDFEADVSDGGHYSDSSQPELDLFATIPKDPYNSKQRKPRKGQPEETLPEEAQHHRAQPRGLGSSCLKSSHTCRSTASDPPPAVPKDPWGSHPAASGNTAMLGKPRISDESHLPTHEKPSSPQQSHTSPRPNALTFENLRRLERESRSSHDSHIQTPKEPALPQDRPADGVYHMSHVRFADLQHPGDPRSKTGRSRASHSLERRWSDSALSHSGRGSSAEKPFSSAQSASPLTIKRPSPFQPPHLSKRGSGLSCFKGSKTCDPTISEPQPLAPPLICRDPYRPVCMMHCLCLADGRISCDKLALVETKSLMRESHFSREDARKKVAKMVVANTEMCADACRCGADPRSFDESSARLQRDIPESKLSASELMNYGSHPVRGNVATVQRASSLPDQLSADQVSSGQSFPGQSTPGQRYLSQSFYSQFNAGLSPLGQSSRSHRTSNRSSSDQSNPALSTPGQMGSGQTSLGQSFSSQRSPDQKSAGQASSDSLDSPVPSGAPQAPSLGKRGGGQSRLTSPDESSSDGSINGIFELECTVRHQESCDIHCRCDDTGNIQCDKQTSRLVKGLSKNYSKGWVKNSVRKDAAITTQRCKEMCRCNNTLYKKLMKNMLDWQQRSPSSSKKFSGSKKKPPKNPSQPGQLVERGGLNSCWKSPEGCSTDTLSTPPPGRMLVLLCQDSSHERECDPQCYCTPDRKVKCDAKFSEDVSKLMPGLRNAYMGKHPATNFLRHDIIVKEKECGENCRCEEDR